MTKIDIRDVFRVRIETDEDGFFHLIAEGEDQEVDLAFGHSEAEALYDTVKREIGPWLYERDQARKAVEAGVTVEQYAVDMDRYGHVAAWRCSPEDVDESGGYDISDPKHPEFHSVHADIYDSRAGK